MNHIDRLIDQASPGQQARARAIAATFAANSGLQAHTSPDGYRLALANVVNGDLHPTPKAASRRVTDTGHIACITVHTSANGTLHPNDRERAITQLAKWPTRTIVRLVAPAIGRDITTTWGHALHTLTAA